MVLRVARRILTQHAASIDRTQCSRQRREHRIERRLVDATGDRQQAPFLKRQDRRLRRGSKFAVDLESQTMKREPLLDMTNSFAGRITRQRRGEPRLSNDYRRGE